MYACNALFAETPGRGNAAQRGTQIVVDVERSNSGLTAGACGEVHCPPRRRSRVSSTDTVRGTRRRGVVSSYLRCGFLLIFGLRALVGGGLEDVYADRLSI